MCQRRWQCKERPGGSGGDANFLSSKLHSLMSLSWMVCNRSVWAWLGAMLLKLEESGTLCLFNAVTDNMDWLVLVTNEVAEKSVAFEIILLFTCKHCGFIEEIIWVATVSFPSSARVLFLKLHTSAAGCSRMQGLNKDPKACQLQTVY